MPRQVQKRLTAAFVRHVEHRGGKWLDRYSDEADPEQVLRSTVSLSPPTGTALRRHQAG